MCRRRPRSVSWQTQSAVLSGCIAMLVSCCARRLQKPSSQVSSALHVYCLHRQSYLNMSLECQVSTLCSSMSTQQEWRRAVLILL